MFRHATRLVLVILLLTQSSCLSTTFHKTKLSNLHWLQGEWKGVGLQLNFPQTWTMALTVEGDLFNISYPTLNCSGEWKIRYTSNRNRIEFLEVIWQGRDNCVNHAKVIITRIDKYHISYSYFSPETGKLEASATLVNTKYKMTLRT